MKKLFSLFLLLFSFSAIQAQQKPWMLGPFLRAKAAKPIIE
ncbi:hypothetical protein [Algoriphagus ratkowskyi]|nr:hypothetical protein [Algoriphagus ratkowskyi]